jgi:hypothetical protein
MSITDYLNKMKKFNDKKINVSICTIHNKEYFSYCFDCNIHLCKECLTTKNHAYHYKLYLMEIIPEKNILNEIEEKIKAKKIKINNLSKEKINRENKLNAILKNNINKIKEIMRKRIIKNKNKENEEIKICNFNYRIKLYQLKEEYENKIKKLKLLNEENIYNIKNKYIKYNDIY